MIDQSASQSATPRILLSPVSAANTAAATGTGVDLQGYDGDLIVTQTVGAVTGSITGKIVTSDVSNLTSSTDLVSFTAVSAANNTQNVAIRRSACQRYIGYVGTVVTGPVLVSVTVSASLKVF
jgi:hypothetical protein